MATTNVRELLGFFLTCAITIALQQVISGLILAPIYIELAQTHRIALITVVANLSAALFWIAAFPLFLLCRALFSGVPPLVSARARRFVTSGAEAGAYALAYVIRTILFGATSAMVLGSIYTALRTAGRGELMRPVALSISVVFAIVFFAMFIGLRRAFAGPQGISVGDEHANAVLGGAALGFGGAIATCFRKYAVFSGRARRSEYWYWVLFEVLLGIGCAIIDLILFQTASGVFTTLATLGLVLPSIAVTVRRLHDIDSSGWLILISLVPLIGAIGLLIMTCSRGTAGPNRFGPEYAQPAKDSTVELHDGAAS